MPTTPPVICLTGFMASGKSTVGRALAIELTWRFIDLDDALECHEAARREVILARYGEPVFRRLETAMLRRVLDGRVDSPDPPDQGKRSDQPERSERSERGYVLALGGGTFVNAGNHALLARRATCVWLDCPFSIVARRIAADARRRRVTSALDLPTLFHARLEAYARAHHRLAVGDDDVTRLVTRIVQR